MYTKIDNMGKVQNITRNYNKIIFNISFINNFTNLKFYNILLLNSNFDCIRKKKLLQFTCYIIVKKYSLFQELYNI